MFPKMVLGPAAIVHGRTKRWRWWSWLPRALGMFVRPVCASCCTRDERLPRGSCFPRSLRRPGAPGGCGLRSAKRRSFDSVAAATSLRMTILSGSSNLLGEGQGEGFEALTEREEGAQLGGEFFGRVVGAAILD